MKTPKQKREANQKLLNCEARIEALRAELALETDAKLSARLELERLNDLEKAAQENRERISHWLQDAIAACEGEYGSMPKGEPIDFWRGSRNALAEVLAFMPDNTINRQKQRN